MNIPTSTLPVSSYTSDNFISLFKLSCQSSTPRVILSGNLAPCVLPEINLAAVVPLQIL